jgi:hypothetical protein
LAFSQSNPFIGYWRKSAKCHTGPAKPLSVAAQLSEDVTLDEPTDLLKNNQPLGVAIMGVPSDKPMASKHDGYAASSVATQVRESPSKPGVIWVDTEDGNLQVRQDGGERFTNVATISSVRPKAIHTRGRRRTARYGLVLAHIQIASPWGRARPGSADRSLPSDPMRNSRIFGGGRVLCFVKRIYLGRSAAGIDQPVGFLAGIAIVRTQR